MGKIDTFTIHLDKLPVYLAGEIVSGRVYIRVKERLKINSVSMSLKGAANVHWTESRSETVNGRTQTRTVSYNGYEEYLNFSVAFLVKTTNNDLYLEFGDHTFQFQIKLPDNLPTSFEHAYGRIRYSLNGTIDIPWAFDKHVKQSITVISPLDLNLNPALRQPYNVSDSKTLCCWCCKSDPIIVKLSIMKSGYVPGEGIVFNASVNNTSTRNMTKVSVQLVQKIILHARTKSRTCTRLITESVYDRQIGEGGMDDWRAVLTIPPVCASSTNTCSIIQVQYLFTLYLSPSGLSTGITLSIPIVIGTIPLKMNDSNESNAPPPYTYQASMFETDVNHELEDKVKDKDEVINMDNNFAPSYPYYMNMS